LPIILQMIVLSSWESSDQKPSEKEHPLPQKEMIVIDYENLDDAWQEYAKNRLEQD